MFFLKISLTVAAVLLIIKVMRTESGTRREKLSYLGRAVTGKSVWKMSAVHAAHDAYYSARRAAYALSA